MGEAALLPSSAGSAPSNSLLPTRTAVDWKGRCVFLVVNADGGVLLDMDNDKFLKLDTIAAEMWRRLAGGFTEEEVADQIARECSTSHERVLEDVKGLIKQMAALSITPEQTRFATNIADLTKQTEGNSFPWYGHDVSGPRPKPAVFSTILAWLGLLLFDLVLSLRCLKSLCAIVSDWKVNYRNSLDREVIGKICIAVEKACVWYPKKAVCLQRSAVTTCLLRNSGMRAQMVFAARPMPLLFHAWVEVEGNVINDHPTVTKAYQRLVSI